MNQENRNKVDDYLNSSYVESLAPLYFHEYLSPNEEFNPDKYSVEDMCRRVLTLTRKFPSYNAETNDYECSSGRNRSSLDIWRHIKYYYPSVTIYDVMQALHTIYTKNDGFIGFFCNDVKRRIFKIGARSSSDRYMENLALYAFRNFDEYGLEWNDWEDI